MLIVHASQLYNFKFGEFKRSRGVRKWHVTTPTQYVHTTVLYYIASRIIFVGARVYWSVLGEPQSQWNVHSSFIIVSCSAVSDTWKYASWIIRCITSMTCGHDSSDMRNICGYKNESNNSNDKWTALFRWLPAWRFFRQLNDTFGTVWWLCLLRPLWLDVHGLYWARCYAAQSLLHQSLTLRLLQYRCKMQQTNCGIAEGMYMKMILIERMLSWYDRVGLSHWACVSRNRGRNQICIWNQKTTMCREKCLLWGHRLIK